ncbi:MAG TPA: YlxR family protein [Nitriliruptorales bacterium]|nr:YlxR family protein [Nitriliruptorales bacterium]
MTHTAVRTCVGCRSARPQRELVRFARTANGAVLDTGRRLPGRGAYVCPDPACIAAARARDAAPLRRSLRAGSPAGLQAALDGAGELAQRRALGSTGEAKAPGEAFDQRSGRASGEAPDQRQR